VCSLAARADATNPGQNRGTRSAPAPHAKNVSQGARPKIRIDLHRAIQLALAHNHLMRADFTLIQQSKANQITASLRPNPTFTTDALFVPFFNPGNLNSSTLDNFSEFDAGIGYTFERGGKRKARMRTARRLTSVTVSQVRNSERMLVYDVQSQFTAVLLAESNLRFARQNLVNFKRSIAISEEQYKAGEISRGELLRTKVQLLQFQTDVSSAEVSLVQSKFGLRYLAGFDALPANFGVIGKLEYEPVSHSLSGLEAKALRLRPDLAAARESIAAATARWKLAKANAKQNLATEFDYTHLGALSSLSTTVQIGIPIFNRNQGEIARTNAKITQAQQVEQAVEERVLTRVRSAYAEAQMYNRVVKLYQSGYLREARESLEISQYAYLHGSASLLDFLDAERTYTSIELSYRRALAGCGKIDLGGCFPLLSA
jgi:cobalt-zinc-cadmium efflux system outer membrane protein